MRGVGVLPAPAPAFRTMGMDRDIEQLLIELSRAQRLAADQYGVKIVSVMRLLNKESTK